ncbi:LysM peptidoglycan-binding domain-containing protein [Neobacillus rhizosphaerae]|uniref:LysM peptidoglycan-binding domain-containing protein n=1 Tax=Neobacillus rhizosphaerae TaxID=2880965 RepID=UPI003D2658AF
MEIKTQYVRVNKYTRPAQKNKGVFGVVWHYTASPKATAQNIRDYFDGTCIRQGRYASAHDAIDKTQVIHMVPHDEVAYHAHDHSVCYVPIFGTNANFTAIGVELCVDANNNLEPETYKNAVEYGVILCKQYKLDPMKHFFRHYDVTHKNCPAFWVKDPAGFEKFKRDVYEKLYAETPKPQVKPAPAQPATVGHYIVQRGDTLYSIANKFKMDVADIQKANPTVNARAMQVGTNLVIPNGKYTQYAVKKGDTFYGIADEFHLNVDDLLKANPKVDSKKLQIGQVINIPTKSSPQPAPAPKPQPATKTVTPPAPKRDQKTNSLVDYLKSINVDSSFANREKLAKKYGIAKYKGTADQNAKLLVKMRGH